MIIVAGESLIDLIVHPDGRIVGALGGGPYNVARTIARLGTRAAFLGRLSSDRFGQLQRASLEADGVELGLAVPTEDPTTLALAELDATGAATYRFYLDGTAAPGLRPADLPRSLPADVRAVHVGTLGLVVDPIASALETFIGGIPAQAIVMVDPNCRPAATSDPGAYRARMGRVLARADVVKVSGDDLAFLAPGVDALTAAQTLLESGPRLILLTDGARSVSIVTADGTKRLPVPPVAVADTVGAGDAFGGAFIASWVADGRGRVDLDDAHAREVATAFAIRVASVTCQRVGADPPTRAELEASAAQAAPSA